MEAQIIDTTYDINEVINLYQNTNMSLIDIAKEIGYKSKDVVYKILKENNIEKRRSVKHKISIENEDEIIKMYLSGLSSREIGKKYNVGGGVIDRILNKCNIVKRKNNKIYLLDETYFSNIDTPNKAYILGFIYADGSIRNDNLCLSVVVHNKDIDILQKIKSELKTDTPVSKIKNKDHSRINICNKTICDDLVRMGCKSNKTYDLKFPILDKTLVSHFIRGFMDGDGCISISKHNNNRYYYSLSFTGTKDLLETLKYIFDVDNKITYYKHAYALHIGKKKDVIRLLNYIYKDCELYLQRKYNKYLYINELEGEICE